MTPQGTRGFPTAALAKAAAENAVKSDFVVIAQPGGREFAWISPVSVYMQRRLGAVPAGIALVEVVK